MKVISTVSDLRHEIASVRRAGKRIAFVPTMGNLHAGHLRLIVRARELAEAVVASIYVNPLQFGPKEDLAAYPRTPVEDQAALACEGVNLLFMPTDREMYPRGPEVMTKVEAPLLGDMLCGAFRPGHFRGVATVVNRLFNLVQPDVAVFGKKDYQQLLVIRMMVSDLGMPVEIEGVDTLREPDGLAMSSRNNYLSREEREQAPKLYAALTAARDRLMAGSSVAETERLVVEELNAAAFRPDYVSVRRQQDLATPAAADRYLVVLAAAWLGRTRLIDNIEVELPVI